MKVNERGVCSMNEREKMIRLWFDMWLYQKDMGIDEDVLQFKNGGLEYKWKTNKL